MIDVDAIVSQALNAERSRADAVRADKRALLEKLMAQRDALTISILGLTAELADVEADVAAIDTAAEATGVKLAPLAQPAQLVP